MKSAIIMFAVTLTLLGASVASAQSRRDLGNVFILFENDPMGIAQDLNAYFSSRGVTAKTFRASSFERRREVQTGTPTSTGTSFGTGFFIDDNGTLITNYHVIAQRPNVVALLPSGNRLPATVLSSSPALDIAVLRIQGFRPTSYIALASTSPSVVSQQIFAIGYPLSDVLGAGAKVTDGVVSSLSGLGDDASTMQISAPIQPGNSGGPVVNSSGEAIGIAVAHLNDAYAMRRYGSVPQNVNFAIKADFARPVADAFVQVTDAARRATSVQQALVATLHLEASVEPVSLTTSRAGLGRAPSSEGSGKTTVVQFKYSTFFDGFTDQLGDLQVIVEDDDTGETISLFAWSGATAMGKRNVVIRATRQLDRDLGLTPPERTR